MAVVVAAIASLFPETKLKDFLESRLHPDGRFGWFQNVFSADTTRRITFLEKTLRKFLEDLQHVINKPGPVSNVSQDADVATTHNPNTSQPKISPITEFLAPRSWTPAFALFAETCVSLDYGSASLTSNQVSLSRLCSALRNHARSIFSSAFLPKVETLLVARDEPWVATGANNAPSTTLKVGSDIVFDMVDTMVTASALDFSSHPSRPVFGAKLVAGSWAHSVKLDLSSIRVWKEGAWVAFPWPSKPSDSINELLSIPSGDDLLCALLAKSFGSRGKYEVSFTWGHAAYYLGLANVLERWAFLFKTSGGFDPALCPDPGLGRTIWHAWSRSHPHTLARFRSALGAFLSSERALYRQAQLSVPDGPESAALREYNRAADDLQALFAELGASRDEVRRSMARFFSHLLRAFYMGARCAFMPSLFYPLQTHFL
jgi:hypothetical protein